MQCHKPQTKTRTFRSLQTTSVCVSGEGVEVKGGADTDLVSSQCDFQLLLVFRRALRVFRHARAIVLKYETRTRT